MAASEGPRPRWTSRLLAAACYLGVAPLLSVLRLVRVGPQDIYLRHHQAQGIAAVVLLLPLLLTWPIFFTLEACLVRNRIWRQPSDFHAAFIGVKIAFLGGLGLWGLTSMVALGMAFAGSTRPLPLVAWLARRPRLMRVALIGNSVLLVLVVLVVGLAIHASSLVRDDAAPAPVYYLYDGRDFEPIGPWVQKLFCYRITRVAQERWGPGSVVVAPITAENFRTAITHGRFVILLSHGSSGAIATIDGIIWPNFPATFATPGKDLQFVYISACDGGEKSADWEQRFAPAEVVTFDRLSAGMEHLWWLWFEAPARLNEIR